MTFEEIAGYCLDKPYAEETYPFDETTMVMKVGGKMFALLDSQKGEAINLKHPSDNIPELIERHACISPGYHMSKKHWITVNYKHPDIRSSEILELVDISYALIIESLPKKMKIPLSTIFKTFDVDGSEYQKALALRQKILRDPLRLTITKDDLKGEERDIHIGGFYKEELTACCILSPVQKIQMKVRQVAVDDKCQGMGIGTHLMEYAENQAIRNGSESIILHARKNVMPWYVSLGYEVIGEEFLEVGIPHVKMFKNL